MDPRQNEKAEVTSAFSALNKVRFQLAEKFLKALKEKRLPWQQPWKNLNIRYGTQQNALSGRRYRGVNAAWLWAVAMEKGYEDPRWCTFKQATDQGWKIRKGEHGVPIEFWSIYDTAAKKKVSREEYDRIVRADPTKAENYKPISQFFTVFNGQQIDGIPHLPRRELNPEFKNTLMQQFTDQYFVNTGIELRRSGDAAYYHTAEDYITMPPKEQFYSESEYYQTLIHECAHSTGHASRLNRKFDQERSRAAYAKEELRAEIASNFVLSDCDFMPNETLENSKAYFQDWAEEIKKDPKVLFSAINDADKIADYIAVKGNLALLLEQNYQSAQPEAENSFSAQVDRFLQGDFPKVNALKVCDTPPVLLNLGLQKLPMLLTQNHLSNILHPKSTDNPHWHGLEIDQVKELPAALDKPAMVVRSWTKQNSIIVISSMVDSDNLPVIISITPNGSGVYELERVSSNFITSVYGKNHFITLDTAGELDKHSFLGLAKNNDAFLHINKKESQELLKKLGLQLPHYQPVLDFINIISQTSQNDNTPLLENPKNNGEMHITADKSTPYHADQPTTCAQTRQATSPTNNFPLDTIKSISLLRVAEDMSYTVIKKGKHYSLKEHDSVMIYPLSNTYCRFSDGRGGSTIDFVANLGGLSIGDAIGYLSNKYTNAPRAVRYNDTPRTGNVAEAYEPLRVPPKKTVKDVPTEFVLPAAVSGKYSRLYAYLTQSRCIEPEVVRDCIHRKLIYEDKNHNVVFVGYNSEGKAAFATKRSTLTDSHFKCDVVGSDQDTGFYIDNKSTKLYVTEAAIDALSLVSMHKPDYTNANYLSTCGTGKDAAVYARLQQHPEITSVCLANDGDKAGQKTNQKISETIAERFPNVRVSVIVPMCKDFNEQLVQSKQTSKKKSHSPSQGQEVE